MWMAEWGTVTRALAERADLSQEDKDKLAIASVLMRLGLPSKMTEKAPDEAYEIANATIGRNTAIIEAVERFVPLLQLFELGRDAPAAVLLPVTVAAQAGAKVMPEHRDWINAHRNIDLSGFWVLKERWSKIATDEVAWRDAVCGLR